jgi:hypothetical protein
MQMYTLSASLKSIGPDVGRMVAFSPGWLENESVWLHMSYKFYLELLRYLPIPIPSSIPTPTPIPIPTLTLTPIRL